MRPREGRLIPRQEFIHDPHCGKIEDTRSERFPGKETLLQSRWEKTELNWRLSLVFRLSRVEPYGSGEVAAAHAHFDSCIDKDLPVRALAPCEEQQSSFAKIALSNDSNFGRELDECPANE